MNAYSSYNAATTTAPRTVVAWISYEPAQAWNSGARYLLSRSNYKLQMVTDAGYANVDLTALRAALPQLVLDATVTAGDKWVLQVSDYASQQAAAEAFLGALSNVGAVID
eukprot:236136-Heterocapsa_arctica.AAC.1